MNYLASMGLRLLLVAGVLLPLTAPAELVGEPAPDFVLKSVSGTNLRLSEYRGRVVMLGFWASWCGDCRAQLRSLEEMFELADDAGFEMLTISLDGDRRQAVDVASSMKLSFPVLLDPTGSVGEMYEVNSMPHVALVDRDGVIRAEFAGFRRGVREDYMEQIRALLNE